MSDTWDVIVVGAGLAGLAAAATAAAGGASTVVLEAHRPGGRARTDQRSGFLLNLGPHALYKGGEGYDVLRRLGAAPLGSPPPLHRYRALAGGEIHVLPTGPGSLVRTGALSGRSKARFAALLARVPRLDPARHAGISVRDWIASYDLPPDAGAMVHALVRLSSYADDVDDLSADAAILQLQRGARSGVVYVDGGWAQLTDRLAARVEVRGHSPVLSVRGDAGAVEIETPDGVVRARAAVVAAGTPAAVRALLPDGPRWDDVGTPVTAACLDVGVRGEPDPGYVLGVDEPIYGTTQSPPARQAPEGDSVVTVIRYGSRSAAADRGDLRAWLEHLGVARDAVAVERFLASLTVTGGRPRAVNGGLAGRPPIDATGIRGVFVAGDWVGPRGLLADASLASGHDAGLAALRAVRGTATMVA